MNSSHDNQHFMFENRKIKVFEVFEYLLHQVFTVLPKLIRVFACHLGEGGGVVTH